MDIKINYNQHSSARGGNCKKIHKQVSECKEGLPPTGSPQMGDPNCDRGVAVYIKTEANPICLPIGVTNRDLPNKPIQKPARTQKPAHQSASHKVKVKFFKSENNENHSVVQNDFVKEFESVRSCFSSGDFENTLLKLYQIIMILIPSISPISMIQEIIELASKIMEIAKTGAVSKLSLNEKRHLANALQWNGKTLLAMGFKNESLQFFMAGWYVRKTTNLDTATALESIALVLANQGKIQDCLRILMLCIKMRVRNGQSETAEFGILLSLIALIHFYAKNWVQSLLYYSQALGVLRNLDDKLTNFSSILTTMVRGFKNEEGMISVIFAWLQTYKENLEREFNTFGIEYARVIDQILKINFSMGIFDHSLIDKCLDIYGSIGEGTKSQDFIAATNEKGKIFYSLCKYDQAKECFEKALALLIENHPNDETNRKIFIANTRRATLRSIPIEGDAIHLRYLILNAFFQYRIDGERIEMDPFLVNFVVMLAEIHVKCDDSSIQVVNCDWFLQSLKEIMKSQNLKGELVSKLVGALEPKYEISRLIN